MPDEMTELEHLKAQVNVLMDAIGGWREVVNGLRDANAKLRDALAETLTRLSAADEAAGGGFMDARYRELISELGIEVDE